MQIVSCDGLSFSSTAWKFKLLPSKQHTASSTQHARSFTSAFYKQAYGLIGR